MVQLEGGVGPFEAHTDPVIISLFERLSVSEWSSLPHSVILLSGSSSPPAGVKTGGVTEAWALPPPERSLCPHVLMTTTGVVETGASSTGYRGSCPAVIVDITGALVAEASPPERSSLSTVQVETAGVLEAEVSPLYSQRFLSCDTCDYHKTVC